MEGGAYFGSTFHLEVASETIHTKEKNRYELQQVMERAERVAAQRKAYQAT